MGFLRKVGRKVNKRLKKIFGTKLGSIVGMVGLYFMMGAAAKGCHERIGRAGPEASSACSK